MERYETTVLKIFTRFYKTIRELETEKKQIALKSYDTSKWRDGTMGQIFAIGALNKQIEWYSNYCQSVRLALSGIDSGYRTLLVAVYVKGADRKHIAEKHGVSISTVYCKLERAKIAFRKSLERLGFTETWFAPYFADIK